VKEAGGELPGEQTEILGVDRICPFVTRKAIGWRRYSR